MAGRKFLAPPYYSQRAVFASPLSVASVDKDASSVVQSRDGFNGYVDGRSVVEVVIKNKFNHTSTVRRYTTL